MNYYEAIRINALYEVLKPSTNYYFRRVARWYSKTFHTPLYMTYKLPIEHILQEFYEERYENMEEEDRNAEVSDLVETDEQKRERLLIEDADKADDFEFIKMSEELNKKTKKTKGKKMSEVSEFSKIPEEFRSLTKTLKDASEKLKEDLPDIDIDFASDSDFEKMIDGYGEIPIVSKK